MTFLNIRKVWLLAFLALTFGIYIPKALADFSLDPACTQNPTLDCIRKKLTENVYYPTKKDSYWAFAKNFAHAGLYEESLKVIDQSPASLNSLNAFDLEDIAAIQIAREASLHPDQVADFRLIDSMTDPTSFLGKHVSDQMKASIKAGAYSKLSSFLMGRAMDVGGGEDEVPFVEEAATKKFKPNATWPVFIQRWKTEVDSLPEPNRSNNYSIIAQSLLGAGQTEQAKNALEKAISPSDVYKISIAHIWAKLGDYDRAVSIAKTATYKPAYFGELLAKADDLIKKNRKEEALTLLVEAQKEISETQGLSNGTEICEKLSVLFWQAGDKARALEILGKINPGGTFINATKLAETYDQIGAKDQAQSIMAELAKPSPYKCAMIVDEKNSEYAVELFRLGMKKEALFKLSEVCGTDLKSGAWIGIYRAAVEAKTEPPKIEDILADLKPYTHPLIYLDLAAFHFRRGETALGNQFLEKAVSVAENAKSVNVICSIAILAHFSGRDDLLNQLLKKAVSYMNAKHEESEHYFTGPIWGSLHIGGTSSKDQAMYSNYVLLAGCFNLIELDSPPTPKIPGQLP